MLEKDDLQAIAELLKPIHSRLGAIEDHLINVEDRLVNVEDHLTNVEDRLVNVEEDTRITRNSVNQLLDWADDASIQVIPLFNRKAK